MKKRNINKIIKITLLGFLFLCTIIVTYLLFRVFNGEKFQNESVKQYEYWSKASVDYEVFLKENPLFDTKLEKDQIVFSGYLDYIKARFYGQTTGDKVADMQQEYSIVAQVEGYISQKDQTTTLWVKEYILTPPKNLEATDDEQRFTETVEIRLDPYKELAKQVSEQTGVSSSVRLNVFMLSNLKIETEHGIATDNLKPMLTIPLEDKYFVIGGLFNEEKNGSIDVETQIEIPLNRVKIGVYSGVLFFLVASILVILFFTQSISNKDPYKKALKKIFKEHGTRLVALLKPVSEMHEVCNEVHSIKDLVKISDELGRPILYQFSSEFTNISDFYVYDEKQVYVFNLKDSSDVDEVNQRNKNEIVETDLQIG